ncbi:hypothetical protein [Rhizomonospora bruguierae]|uniref:hypothetical protein n=1 Tax=Rhizomonospora bruguierae TaxID=1581705 RepID=UPI001BCE4644|nr:hypothetical protein [Micromonospora sp. NBRC 107566]
MAGLRARPRLRLTDPEPEPSSGLRHAHLLMPSGHIMDGPHILGLHQVPGGVLGHQCGIVKYLVHWQTLVPLRVLADQYVLRLGGSAA